MVAMATDLFLASIVNYSKQLEGVQLTSPQNYQATAGQGLRCQVNGRDILIGNRKWMSTNNLSVTDKMNNETERLEHEGKTVMFSAIDNSIVGCIAVADVIKPEATAVLNQLKVNS